MPKVVAIKQTHTNSPPLRCVEIANEKHSNAVKREKKTKSYLNWRQRVTAKKNLWLLHLKRTELKMSLFFFAEFVFADSQTLL